MIETWSEVFIKGQNYLTAQAVAAVEFQRDVSISNGAEIPLPEVIVFAASGF